MALKALESWLGAEVFGCTAQEPGQITVRRLNRAEYNNTIRDLVGLDLQPAADFPADDSGYGFDNNGDVLSVPPILVEKYLAASEMIIDAAFRSAATRSKLMNPSADVVPFVLRGGGVPVRASPRKRIGQPVPEEARSEDPREVGTAPGL